MSGRLGLVGAMPVGERWRAQGYIHDGGSGGVRYLGTFDTEEEASAVFIRAKENAEAEMQKNAEIEVDRILASPTYVYQNGVGRGASLNGTKFKIVQARDPHNVVAAPIVNGHLAFEAQRVVLAAYLHVETATPTSTPPEHLVVSHEPPPRPAHHVDLKKDILRFVSRQPRQDVSWALEFLEANSSGKLANTLGHIIGDRSFSQQIAWMRANLPHVPHNLLNEIEADALSGLFMDKAEAETTSRVLKDTFGNSPLPEYNPEFSSDEWSDDEPAA